MMVWVLWGSLAIAAPEDALSGHWRGQYRVAQELETTGDLEGALRYYRMIRVADPDFAQAVMDVGRVLEALDRGAEAVDTYRSLPGDADSVEALARLYLSREERDAAEASVIRLRDLRPTWPGWRVLLADVWAPDQPTKAADLLIEYLDFVNTSVEDEGMVEVAERVALALRVRQVDSLEAGNEQPSSGVALLERLLARTSRDTEAAEAAAERLEALLVAFEIDQTAAELAQAADKPLRPEDVARLRHAREAFARGELYDAAAGLDALVRDQPQSAVAWAALSDVRSGQGDLAGAEQAMRAAQQLAPLDARYLARWGELLTEAYGPRYDGEAANALARAVRRRGTDAELWVRKARAERRAGSWELAVQSYRRALALRPNAPWASEAQEAVEGAGRTRPDPVELPPAPPPSVPQVAWTAFHRAWAWHERGDPDRALQVVEQARTHAPTFVKAVNLEAAIRVDLGDRDAARRLYRKSLELEEAQPSIIALLAELEAQAGDEVAAESLWLRAAELGDPAALWRQALRQRDRYQWWAARRTLADYFARTTRDPNYEAARRLQSELARTTQLAVGFGLFALVGIIFLPVWRVLRLRWGVGLDDLLARAPREWRDVARICSAIRHEVLKHHTSVLDSVADALDADDPGPAQWAADRLFSATGALAQLDGYVAELETVARRVGIDLNLRYADPLFRRMLIAVERLRGLESELRHPSGRRLPDQLRDLSAELNGYAYAALGRQVAGLSVLEVDAALIHAIWTQITEEPAFLGQVLPNFEVDDKERKGPLEVRIYPADFRDIVANLLRNAAEVSLESLTGQISVALEVEVDAITGLELVNIKVRDTSPHRLTTSMIRGRYISRGLGLAVDLSSRAGGSIHVEEPRQGPHTKAVVVRLPRAEGTLGGT